MIISWVTTGTHECIDKRVPYLSTKSELLGVKYTRSMPIITMNAQPASFWAYISQSTASEAIALKAENHRGFVLEQSPRLLGRESPVGVFIVVQWNDASPF
jgi:hypothetical protein